MRDSDVAPKAGSTDGDFREWIGKSFSRLVDVMARLRGPEGCAWDREQTLSSLRPFILEEAYELVDAIDRGSPEAVCEEVGDLLLEAVFVSQVGAEANQFHIGEVIDRITDKLVRRHPHVFGGEQAKNSREALDHWDDIKRAEKAFQSSILEGIPPAMPALVRALKLSQRAARVGFDWASADAVTEKLNEELSEVQDARRSQNPERIKEEIGDLLFVVVNLARYLDVDPEIALHDANRKFTGRFRWVEESLRARGQPLSETTIDEMEALWKEAKDKA